MQKKNSKTLELFHSAFDKKSYNKSYYQKHKNYWKDYYSQGKKPMSTDYWEQYYRMGSAKNRNPNTELGRAAYRHSLKQDVGNQYYRTANKLRSWAEEMKDRDPKLAEEHAKASKEYQDLADKADAASYRLYGDVRRLEKESMLRNAGEMNKRPGVQVTKSDVVKTKITRKSELAKSDWKSGAKTVSKLSKDAIDSGKKAVLRFLSKFR